MEVYGMADNWYAVTVTCYKKIGCSETRTWQGFASSDSNAISNAKIDAKDRCRDCVRYEAQITEKRVYK